MYIRKEDFGYLESLSKSLKPEAKRRFLQILLKEQSRKAGQELSKVQIVDEGCLDVRGVEPGEFITKTMIKKACMAAKEEK